MPVTNDDADGDVEVSLIALLPAECSDVVAAARLWLFTHPDAGPSYDRAHKVAIESLMRALRRLNNAETAMMQARFNGNR